MSPPSGGGGGACCEITESVDDFHIDTLTLANIKTKPEEAPDNNNSPDPRNFRNRSLRPSRLGAIQLPHKIAMKRPVRPPPATSSSSSSLDTPSLKQALRRMSIVQASEMAAIKRMSRPPGVASGSEAGTIHRLYTSVVVQPRRPAAPGSGEGKRNPTTQLLPIPPEKEKHPSNNATAKPLVESSSKLPTNVSTPANNNKLTVSPTLTKPRVRDIIASTSPRTETQPSPRPTTTVTRQKQKSSSSSAANNITAADPNKPAISPRLARPPLQTNATPNNAIATIPSSSSSSVTKDQTKRPQTTKTVPPTLSKKPTIQTKESAPFPPHNAAPLKPVPEQKSYPLPTPGTAPPTTPSPIITKRIEFPRHLDKAESSQSSKSSIGDYSSTTTSISGDSNQSTSTVIGTRPHKSNDVRWASIHNIETRNGTIGLINFKLIKRLGCGDIGTVYLAHLCGSQCLFALKVMDNEFLATRKKMIRALTEREILQMLDHPFLPTLYTYFTTDNLSCLVMEFCPGGDLHVLRQKQPGRHFSESSARFYVAEVLLALEYLHMLGVVYRDLKPENILVREDGHIMLSDFDLSLRCSVNPFLARASSVSAADCARPSGACATSGCIDPLCLHSSWAHSSCFTPRLISSATPRTRKLKPDQSTRGRSLPQLVVEPTEARSNSFVGTHEYLAPEIIKGEGHGSSVDWWTFGIFLYELLYGKTPFKGSGNEETLANVISQNVRFPDSPAVSFRARDLIRGLLVKEPENRLGSRRGAAEIKRHPFFEGLNWALIRCATPPEMPKTCDYGSIVGEVLNKKEGKAMELKDNGDSVDFELF